MMALPLLLLYELSIWICKVTARDRKAAKSDLEKRDPERTRGVVRIANDAPIESIAMGD